MDSGATQNEADGETAPLNHGEQDSSVTDDVQLLWRELRNLNHMHFRLAALEAQQAGNSLVAMIGAGIMAAILLSAAWLGLLAAAIMALSRHGILTDNILLILLTVILNIVLVLLLCNLIRSRGYYLTFPATLRRLKFMSSAARKKKED
jgi:hypothetical protein